MDYFATFIGYLAITVACVFLVRCLSEYFIAAKWYYDRFNSNNISKIEDVIYDANLRIENLKKEKLNEPS